MGASLYTPYIPRQSLDSPYQRPGSLSQRGYRSCSNLWVLKGWWWSESPHCSSSMSVVVTSVDILVMWGTKGYTSHNAVRGAGRISHMAVSNLGASFGESAGQGSIVYCGLSWGPCVWKPLSSNCERPHVRFPTPHDLQPKFSTYPKPIHLNLRKEIRGGISAYP